MATEQRTVRRIDDPEVLKGLAQPIRQRLWRLLLQLGPCTVKTLAERTGCDPGQVSYHLRELAKRGWVEQAPELARDRRESWWRSFPGSTTWTIEDFPTPEGRAIATHLHGMMVTDQFRRLRHFVQTAEQWSEDWIRVAVSHQTFPFLTAEEAGEMVAELDEVVARWAEVSRRARRTSDTEGRSPYFLFIHGFPEDP
jgi:DNA-binding transcriptional ArsR family regulator